MLLAIITVVCLQSQSRRQIVSLLKILGTPLPSLTFKSNFPVPPDELFDWHERPDAIRRLIPPWIDASIKRHDGIQDGQKVVLRLSQWPFQTQWAAHHEGYRHGEQFVDILERGPFQYWKHVHRFEPLGTSESTLTDIIDFQLKGGDAGERLGLGLARKQISRVFEYRHRITGQDLVLHRYYNPSKVSLRVGITGSSGLIGSELAAFLSTGGHRVVQIVRRRRFRRGDVYWDPETGEIDRAGLENLDAVIHLAGESVFEWKWSPAKKERIRESRIKGTRLLAETLANLSNPPNLFVTASGVAAYGYHPDHAVSEASSLAEGGFLTTVAREWEEAADPAIRKGIRTVILRLGVVLSPRGGILKQVLPFFRSGLGGRFAGDNQWISWISIDDVVGAIYHSMMSTTAGPVNLTTPGPVTSEGFSKSLARVLHRPALVKLPQDPVRRAFGEIADELYFQSARVLPEYLSSAGYHFLYPRLESALIHVLGKKPRMVFAPV